VGRSERRYYTTHEVAGLLGVSLPTVVNWVKSGRLDAHRTPGGHRRIPPEALVRFAKTYEYPVPDEVLERARRTRTVLVVDAERDFAEMVSDYLVIKAECEVLVADTGFLAGVMIGSRRPDVVLLDVALRDLDPARALAQIRRTAPEARVYATSAFRNPQLDQELESAGFDGVLHKPVQLDQLLALFRRSR
jgi:excisionase family DNA binding protein